MIALPASSCAVQVVHWPIKQVATEGTVVFITAVLPITCCDEVQALGRRAGLESSDKPPHALSMHAAPPPQLSAQQVISAMVQTGCTCTCISDTVYQKADLLPVLAASAMSSGH